MNRPPSDLRRKLHGWHLWGRCAYHFCNLISHTLWRLEAEGAEHIPPKGACIIAPNHPSFLDPVIMHVSVPRPMSFIAWKAPFDLPFVGSVMRATNAIPVDAESGGTVHRSLRRSLAVLCSGGTLGIFPEGMRSTGRRLLPFKPGAALLAVQTGAPVVPTTICGAIRVWPRERRLPRPVGRIRVIFHPPVRPPTAVQDKRNAAERLSLQVRAAIRSRLDYSGLEEGWPVRPAMVDSLLEQGFAPPPCSAAPPGL